MLLAAVVASFTGCVSTTFSPYQGSNRYVGSGGAVKRIDGVDLWLTGTPNQPFTIIGYIEDNRPGGPISMAGRDKGIAAEAKQYGGDAVICNSDDSRYMGTYNTANMTAFTTAGLTTLSGSGLAVPVTRRESKYYVLKYIN